MNNDDLIRRLYQHHEDYAQGRAQSIYNIVRDCKDAADSLTRCQTLIENGQSAIDTNLRLTTQITHLLEERDIAIKEICELASRSGETCQYCKHNTPCKGKDCEKYIEGIGMTDEEGRYYNTKWTCMDFNYGTCPLLENTACDGCIQNNCKNFEWKGIEEQH